MKKLTLLFLLFPVFAFSQTVVTLNVVQPPEFGFEVVAQDITILRGDSITLGTDLVVFGGSGEYYYSWSSGETLNDSTLVNPIAFPEDSTTYFLTVLDAYGCSFTLSYTVNVQMYPTAISAGQVQNLGLKAKLFPNPNNGRFKVQLTGERQEKIDLYVIDNLGRVIQKQTVKNFLGEYTETIEIALPNGAYTLLIDSDKERLQRQFIIK